MKQNTKTIERTPDTRETVLKIENLSKTYRLGQIGTGTISHDLNRWWAKIRGKEDPFATVGVANDRSQKDGTNEYVKVLDNINFEVKKGEVLGIIGKNGAGKSTLLKVISQITSPTTGSVKAKGRIASLLEVGTGMHPEMTGRENVYLNGTILGMTKKEIDSKFDEIMDFAGCAKYADTPVKRYSSGMKVRLGFAVAAFLEPEILIVDEVLAVGDAEFQNKAIGKMQDISKGDGRTVLFVSHNMGSVRDLCDRLIVLENGTIKCTGEVNEGITEYLKVGVNSERELSWEDEECPGDEWVKIKQVGISNSSGRSGSLLSTADDLTIRVHYNVISALTDSRIVISLLASDGTHVFSVSDYHHNSSKTRTEGSYISSVCIPAYFLNIGMYFLELNFETIDFKAHVSGLSMSFEISELDRNELGRIKKIAPPGVIHPVLSWSNERLKTNISL